MVQNGIPSEVWELIANRFGLTPREKEVAGLILAEKTWAAIALVLGRSRNTVRANIHELYRKLGVATRLGLAKCISQVWADWLASARQFPG